MTIEETEKGLRLVPENKWELERLRTLRRKGVEKMTFADDWNSDGPLTLHYTMDPWDKRR